MNLHLVGGFLGSGKTTAIINAAKALMGRGETVGVITNDQGKYLVDTAFFRLADLPTVEVTGGCFCCNYDDMDARLSQLIAQSQPQTIFAESVGSCADIIATVVRPLLELGHVGVTPASFSVFTDARLLRRRLLDQDMPFSDDVVYIFDKQIEEAGLVILNKTDLLSEAAAGEVRRLFSKRFPGKSFQMQTSLTPAGVQPWLDTIQSGRLGLPTRVLDIDYARYGTGEAQLAWLDEEIELRFPPGQGALLLRKAISRLLQALSDREAGTGHLKFILRGTGVQAPGGAVKLSFPTLEEPGWQARIPEINGEKAGLLVNARVEIGAEDLKALLKQALDESGINFTVQSEMAFHPSPPRPTHRFS